MDQENHPRRGNRAPVSGGTAAVAERLRERDLYLIAESAARRHHVLVDELLGRSRTQKVVEARRALVQALADEGFSYGEIAAMLDRTPAGLHSLMNGGEP